MKSFPKNNNVPLVSFNYHIIIIPKYIFIKNLHRHPSSSPMFPATFHKTKPTRRFVESSLLKKKEESLIIFESDPRPRLIFHETFDKTFEPRPPLVRPAGKGIFRTVQSRWADILTASGYIPGQFHSGNSVENSDCRARRLLIGERRARISRYVCVCVCVCAPSKTINRTKMEKARRGVNIDPRGARHTSISI